MNDLLRRQFNTALSQAHNAHASNISRDYLDIFVRVAKNEPHQLEQVVDLLINHININRSNTDASLYCLIRLADVSDDLKRIIKSKIGEDFIEFFSKDENQEIANTAIILGKVLGGTPLSEFEPKKEAAVDSPGSTIFNVHNSNNVAINSPNATQSIKVDALDDDLKNRIAELQRAINKRDGVTIGKIFAYITDKSVDVAIALLTQGLRP